MRGPVVDHGVEDRAEHGVGLHAVVEHIDQTNQCFAGQRRGSFHPSIFAGIDDRCIDAGQPETKRGAVAPFGWIALQSIRDVDGLRSNHLLNKVKICKRRHFQY